MNKETAISLLSKFIPENQKQDLVHRLNELVVDGEVNGIIVNTDKTVTLTLALENNELKLNGKPIPDVKALMRIATVWNIPVAINQSSADFMLTSVLFEQDVEIEVPDYEGYLKERLA